MKVYAVRQKINNLWYMPVQGFFSSLTEAKKQAKAWFKKDDAWDVGLYEVNTSAGLSDWVDLLNGDAISSRLDGKVPRDFIQFIKVAFESKAMREIGETAGSG